MTIASEPADDRAARASGIANFLKYGAGTDPEGRRMWFYRHPLFVRITHWTNAVVLAVMLMSGLQIFNAHSALYWGQASDFEHPWLSMVAMQNEDGSLKGMTQIGSWHFDTTGLFGASKVDGQWAVRGFPSWITIPAPQWLAMGRVWHFFFAWLFVINGFIFAALAIARGHFRRDLAPRVKDFQNLPAEIVHHAKLQFPKGEAAKRYNSIQRLTYFSVIFVIAPLIVLTGLTMSPTMDAAFPFLPWIFAGRQSARSIHFLCAFAFVLFFLVHIIMVVLSGTWNNLRSMITGNYEIEDASHG